MRRVLPPVLLTAGAVATAIAAAGMAGALPAPQAPSDSDLRPTAHDALPARPHEYWLVPPDGWRPPADEQWRAARDLARAADLIGADKARQALPLIDASALADTPLAGYAAYLRGLAELELDRIDAARRTFSRLVAARPPGYLYEAASLALADAAESQRDFQAAVDIYEDLLTLKSAAPDDLQLRLGRAATAAGNRPRAIAAYQALYFGSPGTDEASAAEKELAPSDLTPLAPGNERFSRELARAEQLFAARRFAPAREAFEPLLPHAEGDNAELVGLRLVECDYHLRRLRRVRQDLRPFLDGASRSAEASYYDLMAARDLGRRTEFVTLTNALAKQFPDSPWTEDALNNLATFFIVDDQDDKAEEVFRQLAAGFPTGRYTARAAWRVGWWAYRAGRHAEAADTFERAAAVFPQSDYRPAYLYWAGRAREKAGDGAAADARLRLAVIDYANSYYGRLAAAQLKARGSAVPGPADAARHWAPEAAGLDTPAPAVELVQWLIAAEMYDEALDEVAYAGRTWGDSAPLQATRAWLLNRTGELRPAISLMRRTYPQFLAAGGETLPIEIRKIIFPLDHWPLIKQHAAAMKLDPYLVAALIAQESTFDKDVKSGAGAYGLMQIMPTTGRRWARRLGIRAYSTRKLTVADVNVRIGTNYFADLLRRFDSVHVALAGYNAGDSRAAKWTAERPGMPADEFVDDIPFPETQNYIRRILGTVEDYRALYAVPGPESAPASSSVQAVTGAPPKPVIVKSAKRN